jgi:carbon-monoxide dehydrogenase medium subunit
MHPFSYRRASSLADARARLGGDADATLLAGGMTLLPTLKQRLATPSQLIDIGRLAELRGIACAADAVTIGAGVTHREVAGDAGVARAIPALAQLAASIGDPQVRARGTLGGSIANNDPAADYPAAVLGLAAEVSTDRRAIPGDAFFTGMFSTALAPGEIVTAVRFRVPRRAAYAKFAHPASGYAMTGAFVADFGAQGVRVAITGAAPCVFRWAGAERALAGGLAAARVPDYDGPPDELNSDLHAGGAYRANLIAVMTRRAVAHLLGDHA